MIEIRHLTASFEQGGARPVRALDDISLDIADGEFVVIIGSNGSGKSTLLNALAGNVAVDSGRIAINGTEVTGMEAYRRAKFIGRVFQNPFSGTAPTMTVAENLRLASLRGRRKGLRLGLGRAETIRLAERCAELGMGLEDRLQTPIGLLSGGQRQALTLLMATLREPEILLLDEHTAALDPGSAEQVMTITDTIVRSKRLTTLMVTHDMEQAAHFGSRLLMMRKGGISLDISGKDKDLTDAQTLAARFTAIQKEG